MWEGVWWGGLGGWSRAVGYLRPGRIEAARRALDTDPHVVRAKFDEVIKDKTSRIHQYKQAVAQLIAQQEQKLAKVKQLTADVEQLERLRAGALAKAKQVVERLKATGKDETAVDEAAIKGDADYLKCLGAYNDFSSTLGEKQSRIAELERDIQDYGQRIGEHKVQLQSLLREIEKVKAEAADTVADMITAKQETEVGDMLAGIAQDGTSAELQRLRELRGEVKAEAKISKERGGMDARAQEAEFLDYARRSSANSEFDTLIGLSKQTDAKPVQADRAQAAPLPE